MQLCIDAWLECKDLQIRLIDTRRCCVWELAGSGVWWSLVNSVLVI